MLSLIQSGRESVTLGRFRSCSPCCSNVCMHSSRRTTLVSVRVCMCECETTTVSVPLLFGKCSCVCVCVCKTDTKLTQFLLHGLLEICCVFILLYLSKSQIYLPLRTIVREQWTYISNMYVDQNSIPVHELLHVIKVLSPYRHFSIFLIKIVKKELLVRSQGKF